MDYIVSNGSEHNINQHFLLLFTVLVKDQINSVNMFFLLKNESENNYLTEKEDVECRKKQ